MQYPYRQLRQEPTQEHNPDPRQIVALAGHPDSPATPHRPASRTEITAILADHRQIPALATQLPGRRLRRSAAGRRLQDAHLLQRQALFVEDAEHRVTVDDQLREVGDGRGRNRGRNRRQTIMALR